MRTALPLPSGDTLLRIAFEKPEDFLFVLASELRAQPERETMVVRWHA